MTSTKPIGSPPPTIGEILQETDPLIGYIPVAGPPVLLVVVPWVLFALMLAGPFALLITLVVLFVAATALIGLVGVILRVAVPARPPPPRSLGRARDQPQPRAGARPRPVAATRPMSVLASAPPALDDELGRSCVASILAVQRQRSAGRSA